MRVVAFTGHRPQGLDAFHEEAKRKLRAILQHEIQCAIKRGANTFLSGMAMGVDLIAAEEVLHAKKAGYPIRLLAVLPFQAQANTYPPPMRTRYEAALAAADEVILLQQGYTKQCFEKRNRYLVERCDLLVAVFNGNERTGTAQTMRMARHAYKEIHIYYPNAQGDLQSRIERVEWYPPV